MRFSSRFRVQMTSPITAAQVAARSYRGDKDLIDLSQGAPSHTPPSVITDALRQVVTAPEMSGYTFRPGIEALRTAICANIETVYGGNIGPSSVIVTAGCNQAFCMSVSSLCDPGDEVIVIEPYYFNHDMWLRLENILPIYVDSRPTYLPDVDRIAAAVTPKTRALVLVSPSNPTGVTIDPELFTALFEFCKSRGIVLIVDETYRMFRSNRGRPHDLYLRKDVLEHCIFLLSFSKEYAIPGYRVGALISNEDCVREVMKMFDCITICAPRIGQEAALLGLRHGAGWLERMANDLNRRAKRFRQVMHGDPSGFQLCASGSYFGWVKHPCTGATDQDVVVQLVEQSGLLVLPGSIFVQNLYGFLRFSISSADATQIDELPSRLNEFAMSA